MNGLNTKIGYTQRTYRTTNNNIIIIPGFESQNLQQEQFIAMVALPPAGDVYVSWQLLFDASIGWALPKVLPWVHL